MNIFIRFLCCVGIVFLAAFIGNMATMPNIAEWYAVLQKPVFNPPNWIFGPVWTLLYLLMSISLFLVWQARTKINKRQAFTVFGAQLFLNVLWSIVFFGFHSPVGGLIVIIALLGMIAGTIKVVWPIHRVAAYLLVPYLAWVLFATILNIAIVALN